ncbi:MAG: fumarate reductase flavoprotein subunit, partial [Halioglobus sp.]|nr:fumarate reductase flavoprotein subunit [Halioglobus sp.]
KVELEEHPDAAGLITARNFGGTAKWRTSYVSDGTGHSMLYTVSDQAIAASIPVHERMEALSLIHDGARCFGAIARNLMTGELVAYNAHATCIATGGFGRIYQVSTNAIINQGMGAALALETGFAELGNMEAVQFHPTAIFPAGILVTEGCRGDGGLLLDKNEHRFMPDYEPEKAELASRDVVSRHMESHIRKGLGVQSRFGEHLWLDIRLLGEEHINTKLREVKEICQYFLGIDPARELIPVRPAQHYSMGGIRTDAHGHSSTLPGLFACGEAACWDLHGFNRLGGNSVAETVVAGMIVGEAMADFCTAAGGASSFDTVLVRSRFNREQAALEALRNNSGSHSVAELNAAMQATMTRHVGIYRDAAGLAQAVEELTDLLQRCKDVKLTSGAGGADPELVLAYRLPRMLKLALCVAEGALNRTESRGAHCRVDFPERDDNQWLNRTLASWPEGTSGPQLRYEALDIMTMELPPAWRGYGSRDFIAHPRQAERQREVDTLAQQHTNRFERQHALMPYTHLLPEQYRARNARFLEDDAGNVAERHPTKGAAT